MDDTSVDPRQALAALQAEKERRLQAKVDAGKVVRVPLTVVVEKLNEAGEAIATAEAEKERELRKSGETRPIHFDKPRVIVTGVPRPRKSNKQSAASVTVDQAASTALSGGISRPSPSSQAGVSPACPRYVWIQTRECEDSLDPGSIIEGKYHIAADGEVIVTDMAGNFLAGQMPFPGQDPASLARTLLRSVESSDNSFNRKISSRYSYSGIA